MSEPKTDARDDKPRPPRWGQFGVGSKAVIPRADTKLFVFFTELGPVDLDTGKKVNVTSDMLTTARRVNYLTANATFDAPIQV